MLRLLLRRPPSLGGCVSALGRALSGWPAAEVRRVFLDFFTDTQRHLLVPSSPVRPRGDPSLLFVNAGMNQFKPLLLGTADPRSEMASYRRVANSQKCVRAGGKHNDLDDVGRDGHHHTFFEMLGSWSFGDYFKEEACHMAWTLLTDRYGIPADRLYVSYFGGDAAAGLPADLETRDIWMNMGLPGGRVLPFGLKENFWEMGESGPCGPCSEIHYDHVGGRDAAPLVNRDHPEVVEIWNLVFMQYSREGDGGLRGLPRLSVDTGMGLERLVSVLQGRRSNYDTDVFTPLLAAIHQRSGVAPYGGRMAGAEGARVDMAYRVVADHVRTLSVCIADGVHPGMTGAELVLRRILRRAVRFSAEVLQAPRGTLASLVPTVGLLLGAVYPELLREQQRVMDVIEENEDHFLSSLRRGGRLIGRTLGRMDAGAVFPAAVVWSLHRDLGFPLDLVDLILEENKVHVDRLELERLIADHQKASSDWSPEAPPLLDVLSLSELESEGVPHTDDSLKHRYHLDQDQDQDRYVFPACRATVLALYDGRSLVHEVREGQRCSVVLDRTNFYAQQGGQSHDRGYFTRIGQPEVVHPVEGVVKGGGYVVHHVTTNDVLRTGDQLELHLDQPHRLSLMINHTATHVLSFVLRALIGPSLHQRGSAVSAERLRFDFSIKASLDVDQLQQVERRVSDIISANHTLHTQEVPLERALTINGLRTLDEVYPDPVRVVSVGVPVSELLDGHTDGGAGVELCCGTHLLRTSLMEDLVILSERQLVRGVSRVVAVTGRDAARAREAGQALSQEVDSLSVRLSGSAPSSIDAAHRLSKEVGVLSDAVDNTAAPQWQRRELQARLRTLQRKSNGTVRNLENKEAAVKVEVLLQTLDIKEVLVLAVETDSLSVLVKMASGLAAAAPSCHVMLLSHRGGRVLSACQVPKVSPALAARDWAKAVSRHLGGGAGGSELAATGTGSVDDITEAVRLAREVIESAVMSHRD